MVLHDGRVLVGVAVGVEQRLRQLDHQGQLRGGQVLGLLAAQLTQYSTVLYGATRRSRPGWRRCRGRTTPPTARSPGPAARGTGPGPSCCPAHTVQYSTVWCYTTVASWLASL